MELGEGRTVLPGKRGDVWGLKVEWPESNGSIHILSVQLFSGLLSVLDCFVAEETFILRTKLELERFLLIPWAFVCSDCRIRRMVWLKGCGQELAAEYEYVVFYCGSILVSACR